LKLKKLFAAEIVSVVVVLVVVMVFVEITPYLASSKQGDQIGVFNQKQYAQKTVTLQTGQRASSQFNYSTYDPAILVVDLQFQDWQTPGILSLYCNGILIVTVEATPNNPSIQLTAITVSGFDLVKPPPVKSAISFDFTYGNEISLVSPETNGYEGTFNYQISIRGSR
jgi:hypothetical protein